MELVGERTTITLSNNYYSRFFSDIYTFGIESRDLVNLILHAYCEDAKNFSFGKTFLNNEYSFRFKNALLKLSNASTEQTIKKTRRVYEKGSSRSFMYRINNDIYNEARRDALSQNQPMTFIRDLIEEYLDLPFEKRESVVLYRQIEDVNSAIKQGRAFEYTYMSGSKIIMHPYRIISDHNSHFNYVVGHRTAADQYDASTFLPNSDNVGTIRLLNMLYSKNKSTNFTILPDKCKINEKAIKDRLDCTSVSFLTDDKTVDLTVLLNPTGENMFRTIVQNRPQYISHSDKYENGFRCYKLRGTTFQASIYFCSFEDKARIIDPPEAVERIKKRLKEAYDMYH